MDASPTSRGGLDTMFLSQPVASQYDMSSSTIGVVGGMGPEATNRFMSLITAFTPSRRDQDHIPVIAFSNCAIPSRVDALNGDAESPLPEMIRTGRVLEQAGANFLTMPCNIAHHFIDELRCGVSVPVLDMIGCTIEFMLRELPDLKSVGILSATPTHGLYSARLRERDRVLIAPNGADQTRVMDAIYGPGGIKCGYIDKPAATFDQIAQNLLEQGADVIVAACTEVSVALLERRPDYPFVDSMQVLAEESVQKALSGFGLPVGTVGITG